MRQVNWTALNRALCEALKVEPTHPPNLRPHVSEFGKSCKLCKAKWFDGFWSSPCAENKIYPNIISVDALLQLLAARRYTASRLRRHANGTWGVWLVGSIEAKYADTPGHALALAAAAALGVEVPYAE